MKTSEERKLEGLSISKNGPKLNHLLLADDTMLFAKTDSKGCTIFSQSKTKLPIS